MNEPLWDKSCQLKMVVNFFSQGIFDVNDVTDVMPDPLWTPESEVRFSASITQAGEWNAFILIRI